MPKHGDTLAVFSLRDFARTQDLLKMVGLDGKVDVNKSMVEFKFSPSTPQKDRDYFMRLLDSEDIYYETDMGLPVNLGLPSELRPAPIVETVSAGTWGPQE